MYLQSSISYMLTESAAIKQIQQKLSHQHLVSLICYYTEDYDVEQLKKAITEYFPGIPVQGCSSYQGIMTEKGYHDGPVVGLLAIYDNTYKSVFGTGISTLDDAVNPSHDEVGLCITQALDQALLNADRVGEIPSLIIMHATPGFEELMMTSIDNKFGTLVPLIGGSAGDNHIDQKWSIFTENGHTQSGASVTLVYSEYSVFTSFSAGYQPTQYRGTVTKVNGRVLMEIDNKPAVEVYNQWANYYLSYDDNERIFEKATSYPLGRVAGSIYQRPYFKLSHPVRKIKNDCIEFFTSFNQGDEIYLMHGNKDQLITRSAKVIDSAYNQRLEDMIKLGGINIFCAGPMVLIKEHLEFICLQMRDALDGKPFICPFTFGEQGRFIGGENAHGNLMISSAVFHKPKSY
ncbi:histidine kinase [Vibrio sp. 10N.286.49.B3]|uniref:FIST signal transduction protein n=1 Tax=Vibrio sp. 10N.286.49.B3 TaxID=1880855 RepID=UPI000C81E2FE|nr:FIST N-terminal domain-containing protein [Vibrio sp. 10N.286.49.B3]PMH46510.1 histidine kinase [Vibrio sp. 10N.286.49.B3]